MGKVVDNKILFLTLRVFSATGGIEKVCRVLGKALNEIVTAGKGNLEVLSMYGDAHVADNNPYFPAGIFTGYSQSKWRCALAGINKGRKKDVVVLSHVNLLPIGWLIKKISGSTRLVLLAHGIEVWQPLPGFKKRMLRAVDEVVAVSAFTRDKMISEQGVPPGKITVINNCLDPFLRIPSYGLKNDQLRTRYGLQQEDTILFTLTRIAATERHKGYDKVIRCMAEVEAITGKKLVYVIGGKYTEEEAARIRSVAEAAGVGSRVILTGFVVADEMAMHFEMADVYVMPSSKEGFGIVFVEAMYYNLPVIAGNKDGSVDALANGTLGLLADPDDDKAVQAAIVEVLNNKEKYRPDQLQLEEKFGYDRYKKDWERLMGFYGEESETGNQGSGLRIAGGLKTTL